MTTPQSEKRPMTKEQKQLIVLGVLGVVLLFAGWSTFFPGSKTSPPAQANKPKDGRIKNSDLKAGQQPNAPTTPTANDVFGPMERLPIELIAATGGSVDARRNVFDYPPPPPERPKPRDPVIQLPPPTIALGSISPTSAIAGSPRDITVTLSGTGFPADSQVFWDGRPLASQRLSDNVLRVVLTPSETASPHSAKVEVKSKSQPKELWSRAITFELQGSPEPTQAFIYTGRIGDQALITFRDTNKRPALVSVGDTIAANVPWKVLTIGEKQLELLDTRNEVRKVLTIAPKAND